MTHEDRCGLPISTSSDSAASHYRTGVDLLLSAWPGAEEALDDAIAADSRFAVAYAARARLHAFRGELVQAKHMAAGARTLVQRGSTDREKSHVNVVSLGIEGQSAQSLRGALEHLERWPLDAVVMSLPLGAFGLFAFSGMEDPNQACAELCDRHAKSYATDDWWFITNRGWACVEVGQTERGRELIERSLTLRAANANAAHGLVHALTEGGQWNETDTFISRWLPSYDPNGLLFGHICWHQALVALDGDDPQRALQIYREFLQPAIATGAPINVVTDSASLLWRLQAYGHDVPRRLWDEAASSAAGSFPRTGNSFVDIHMALLSAATENSVEFDLRMNDLILLLEAENLRAGPVVPAICRGLQAFATGDARRCAEILEPFAGEFARIGGSHAQRELIDDALILSLIRSGATEKARSRLDQRLHRRQSGRDSLWRSALC